MQNNVDTNIATSAIHSGWLGLLNRYHDEIITSPSQAGEAIMGDCVDIRVAQQTFFKLNRHTIDLSLPIKIASMVETLTFGVFSLALSTAPTLHSLLSIISKHSRFLGAPITIDYRESKLDHVELVFLDNPISSNNVSISENGILLYVCVILTMIRRSTYHLNLEVEWHVPASLSCLLKHARPLQQELNCHIVKQAGTHALRLKRKSLFCPLGSPSLELHTVAIDMLKQQSSSTRPNNIVLRVSQELDQLADLSVANVEYIAQQLGMTSRTLNRRFNQVNTNYRSVLESYKLDKALRQLTCSKLSITIIAHQLGFTEVTAFSRAFKRWTGYAPSYYRKRNHSEDTEQQTHLFH